MKMGLFGRIVDSLALAFTLASCLQASIDRGAIQGTVTDPQGGVIPQAKVSVTNLDTTVQTI